MGDDLVSRGEDRDELLEKKEKFILDARLTEMINNAAFHAVLDNGHTLVAYRSYEDRKSHVQALAVGDRVRVRLSPYDMSRGEVVMRQGI